MNGLRRCSLPARRVMPSLRVGGRFIDLYSGLFLSSSLAISLFSSLAVFFALMGPLSHSLGLRLNRLPSLIEFALIAAVLMVMYFGAGRDGMNAGSIPAIGGAIASIELSCPAELPLAYASGVGASGADPHRSWVGTGMFCAIARDLGLAPGRVDRHYVASVGEVIDHLLVEQINTTRATMKTWKS